MRGVRVRWLGHGVVRDVGMGGGASYLHDMKVLGCDGVWVWLGIKERV